MTIVYEELRLQFYISTRLVGSLRACPVVLANESVPYDQRLQAVESVEAACALHLREAAVVTPGVVTPEAMALLKIAPIPDADELLPHMKMHAALCGVAVRERLTADLERNEAHNPLADVMDLPVPEPGPARDAWLVAGAWSDGLIHIEDVTSRAELLAPVPLGANKLMRTQARFKLELAQDAVEFPGGIDGRDLKS